MTEAPIQTRRKWATLTVVGAVTFMSALDGSIVNIALPVIGRETRAPVSPPWSGSPWPG